MLQTRAVVLTALIPFLFLIFPIHSVTADLKSDLTQVYDFYSKGDYVQAIDTLSTLNPSAPKDAALVDYWKGLCQNRIQAFDQSIESFKMAIKNGAQFKDLHYELGQALYASQKLKLAIKAFSKSISQGYKVAASTYYIGFSYQLLEDYKSAYKHYKAVIDLPDDSERVKQGALFQIGDIKLLMVQELKKAEIRREKLKNHILPLFSNVMKYDETSSVGIEAAARIRQITAEIDKDEAYIFRNGAPAPRKRWLLRATEETKYDTNVVTQANNSLLQISNAASFLFRSEVYGRYDWIIDRRWVISPEINTSYTHYSNQTEPFAFQNENISTTAALKNRLEHSFNGKPAAFNLNFEMNYFMRDWKFNHTLPFYSRHYSFTVAERLPLFDFGATIFTGNLKFFGSQDANQNAILPTLTVTQNIQLDHGAALSFSVAADYNRAAAEFWDRRDYRFTSSLNVPQLFYKIDAAVVFDFTLVDTMNQSLSRGMEKVISPSIVLFRTFPNGLFISGSYGYINNISLDQQNYAYKKSTYGMSLGYYF